MKPLTSRWDYIHKEHVKEDVILFVCSTIYLFPLVLCVSVLNYRAYSLFVFKMLLNTNRPMNLLVRGYLLAACACSHPTSSVKALKE